MSSLRVLSTPKAKAMVDNFLMLFNLNCKMKKKNSETKAKPCATYFSKGPTGILILIRVFGPCLRLILGQVPNGTKVSFFPNFKEKLPNSQRKKITCCYNLAALYHSKFYLCIPNFEIGLLVIT